MKSGILLFAHGSRDPAWAAPFRAIEQKLAQAMPEAPVTLAFLEFMQPNFADAVDHLLASGCAGVTVAPLFMARGAHLTRDLAQLVGEARSRHPELHFSVLPAAGEVESVLDAIVGWLTANTTLLSKGTA